MSSYRAFIIGIDGKKEKNVWKCLNKVLKKEK